MRRTGWRKTLDLTDRIEWKCTAEPQVIAWTVKAVDRNLWAWTSIFAVPFLCLIGMIIYFYKTSQPELATTLTMGSPFIIFIYFKLNFEKTVFVYRATEESLEICQWQDIPDLVFTFLRVFPFLVIGIILMALISNPVLSIAALAGPALVGILLATVGGDSNYKAIYKKLKHSEYRWDEVLEATLDTHHGLIALTWRWEIPPEWLAQMEKPGDNYTQKAYLYFRRDQQNRIVDLVKKKLPMSVELKQDRIKYVFSG